VVWEGWSREAPPYPDHAIGGVTQMKRDGVRFDDDAVHMALDQVAVAARFRGSIFSD
jgi:hypothetical protein